MKRHVILTPEHVLIELPPAGLGSRFLALTADFTIIAGVSSLLATVFAMTLPAAVAGALSVDRKSVV